ncbi:helix-turn-helix domain-containing protein [uncultured Ruminococcus sp.]|uniref:helix-turn-helix domain-containing protein n=1 Tax=uncultured Ruminococcus sp. TaxID=165186 RepID=UPI00265CF582|nr:helix-turn-helix transcriptional regulator [uncultured Ruminococcus sp.]
MNIGKNIKKYRKDRGITQEELAKCAGVSQAMVNYFEKGLKMPSVIALAAIAKKLGVKVDELIN